MLLIKSQCLDEPIDIGELMSYSLTPVPHRLGTPDGFFNKTNKAEMLHYLIDDTPEEVVVPANSMYIYPRWKRSFPCPEKPASNVW